MAVAAPPGTLRAEQQVTTLREDCIVMAAVADEALVRAGEREGRPRVIESGEHEALLAVASLAFRRERRPGVSPGRLVVHVPMASRAEIHRLVPHGNCGTVGELALLGAVAVAAENLGVAAAEREAGVPVVHEVEMLRVKAFRAVAGFAALLELAVMDVLMTTVALRLERAIADGRRHSFGKTRVLFLPMALGAFEGPVAAGERKPAQPSGSMVEAHRIEALDAVTARAVGFELSEVRILLVAIGAFRVGDSPVSFPLVAPGAGDRFVFSEQSKPGCPMIEFRPSPGGLGVASLAVVSETRPMRIVRVAVGALSVGDSPKHVRRVAPGTGDFLMFSEERKPGGAMVELGLLPRGLGMASLAAVSEAGPMGILVAFGAARESEPIPLLIDMALLALHATMGTREAEAGTVMVEADVPKGSVDGVTFFAARSEAPAMHVLVAAGAARVVQEEGGGVDADRGVRRTVAFLTLRDPAVKAFEGIARLAVIEGFAIQAHHREVLSLMVRVARGA
jgi:hypothetical protein